MGLSSMTCERHGAHHARHSTHADQIAGQHVQFELQVDPPRNTVCRIRPTVLAQPKCSSSYSPLVGYTRVCIIKLINSKDVIKNLKSDGWFEVAGKGDHVKFKHATKPGHVLVPHPKKDLPIGTLRNIFRQADWDWKGK